MNNKAHNVTCVTHKANSNRNIQAVIKLSQKKEDTVLLCFAYGILQKTMEPGKGPADFFLITRSLNLFSRRNDLSRRNGLLCRWDDLLCRRKKLINSSHNLICHRNDLFGRRNDLLCRWNYLFTRRSDIL